MYRSKIESSRAQAVAKLASDVEMLRMRVDEALAVLARVEARLDEALGRPPAEKTATRKGN